MITLKIMLTISTLFTARELAVILADMGETNVFLLVSSIITAIFGGLVLVITTRSNAKIAEMKVTAELEKIRNDAHKEVQKVQADAQRAVSLINSSALTALQSSVNLNTAETVKGVAAADQVKQRVEQLESKLPGPRDGEITEVHVTNSLNDPVPTKVTK